MGRSQTAGAFIMVGALLEMMLFLYGISRRSYLALALPVMGALAGLSALSFWIGWTMFSSEEELPEELEEEIATL